MARLFESRARHLGLTRPQWRVISGLYGNDGMTQTELAERTAIARSPLGKIVDQLERKRYIERRGDPEDRRINRLFLTAEVEPILAPARDLSRELEAQVLDGLPDFPDAAEMLRQLSSRLQFLVASELRRA